MEFMMAREAREQSHTSTELNIQDEIKCAVKQGRNMVRIITTKIPDYILDKFRELGYNIEETPQYFNEFMYKIKWE